MSMKHVYEVACTLSCMFSSRGDCSTGGYGYEFVDTIPSKYNCQICKKVLRDARLTACCGQHYCDSCLAQWMSGKGKKRTCPHCKKENFQSNLNKEKIREINELRVRCVNRRKGCGWVGVLETLRNHQQSDNGCDYEEVECPNTGYEGICTGWSKCPEAMERRFIGDHKDHECPYRDYTCEHCEYVDTYDAIAGTGRVRKTWLVSFMRLFRTTGKHYDTCDHFPEECPNECGERDIKRKDMETHFEVCPLQPIDCPYKDAGCTHKIPRKDMESHIKSSMKEHLMMVFKSNITQKAHIEKHQAHIERLEAHIERLKAHIEKLEARMQYLER